MYTYIYMYRYIYVYMYDINLVHHPLGDARHKETILDLQFRISLRHSDACWDKVGSKTPLVILPSSQAAHHLP